MHFFTHKCISLLLLHVHCTMYMYTGKLYNYKVFKTLKDALGIGLHADGDGKTFKTFKDALGIICSNQIIRVAYIILLLIHNFLPTNE